MRDLFVEDAIDMSRGGETFHPDAAQDIREALAERRVCPFCGAVKNSDEGPCPRCTMENTAASRQATKSRIGPWYVFQTRNPAAPGMKFETLLGFVRKDRIKARSVVRGPTTHQLWRFAAHVKGLSREFGICYSCGGAIERTASLCPHCNRLQDPPANPDLFLEGQEAEAPAPKAVFREIPAERPASPEARPRVAPPREETPDRRRDATDRAIEPEDDETRAKKAEGFLSPADLAAAFNLDFRPKGRFARRTAAASRPSAPKPKRRWGRRLLLLAFLGAVGVGAWQFAKHPELRAQTAVLSTRAMDWSRQKWASIQKSSAGTHSTVGKVATPTVPSEPPQRPQPAAQTQPTEPQPATAPPVKANPWDQLYGDRGSQAVGTRQGTEEDVQALYRAAIDAKAQGDYAAALKKFTQIKEFSPDLWPRDLDLRIREVRRLAQ